MAIRVLDPIKHGKRIVLGSTPRTIRKVFRTIDKELCGSRYFTSGITFFEPGQASSMHNHPGSEEVNFIIKGSGVVEGAKERIPFREMQYVFIPKGARHRHRNTGRGTMVLLWIYTPPGRLPKE
ncbi:MAG: cupin domain-containing protein [Candidatus Micrarchaeota archaeon]|nr:cupin domain-containing protein [Candidatus Micrarchaeota archaeon]